NQPGSYEIQFEGAGNVSRALLFSQIAAAESRMAKVSKEEIAAALKGVPYQLASEKKVSSKEALVSDSGSEKAMPLVSGLLLMLVLFLLSETLLENLWA